MDPDRIYLHKQSLMAVCPSYFCIEQILFSHCTLCSYSLVLIGGEHNVRRKHLLYAHYGGVSNHSVTNISAVVPAFVAPVWQWREAYLVATIRGHGAHSTSTSRFITCGA